MEIMPQVAFPIVKRSATVYDRSIERCFLAGAAILISCSRISRLKRRNMRRLIPLIALGALVAAGFLPGSLPANAQGTAPPVSYKVTFPEAEHHWMQVEVTFTNLATQ